MTDEMRLNGMGIAPGVFETIAAHAACSVEGIVSVDGGQSLAGLVGKTAGRGIEVEQSDDGSLTVSLHVSVAYGRPLHDVGRAVQEAVTSALESMTDQEVTAVDVFVDHVAFTEK
jgi:uncharacterized alkaline shock family protein YloU